MNLRIKLLELLEDNRGRYVSGTELADMLSVSRNAVWKAVQSLAEDGHAISAVKNRGYMLSQDSDVLSETGIQRCVTACAPFEFKVLGSVVSTNTVLKEMAVQGAPEGLVIAARGQTGGKGRFGRNFYAPEGCGAYFSLLLRPNMDTAAASLITSAAAVAVSQAIEELTGIRAGIKWVNDVYVDGRKVCGILTEAALDMESGLVANAVLGIGINIALPEGGMPQELRGVAVALSEFGAQVRVCNLIAAVLDKFWPYYNDLGSKGFLPEYRSRSILLGQEITVISPDGEIPARAEDIDDECRLIVRYDGGVMEALNSGEVSVRKLKGEGK